MHHSVTPLTVEGTLSWEARENIRQSLLADEDPFVYSLPKVELHVHIEGTLTPRLKWKLAQRNGIALGLAREGIIYITLEQLKDSYERPRPRPGHVYDAEEEKFTFFEAFYGGVDVPRTREDFFGLALNYFEQVAASNVRYCEVFFDPQSHTQRGISWDAMMGGFRDAQRKAKQDLNLDSQWIMCFLRDLSPQSAMQHYEEALPYRDMILAIGLDSDEDKRPPSLFEDVFKRARADGFRLTCHCDVATENTHEHIRQVLLETGGTGANRIDHGINAIERPELVQILRERDLGVVLCPWSYLRHQPENEVGPRIKALYDQGVRLAIASDDPAYMEGMWMVHNLLLLKQICGFGRAELAVLARNAIEISWAPDDLKSDLLDKLAALTRPQVE